MRLNVLLKVILFLQICCFVSVLASAEAKDTEEGKIQFTTGFMQEITEERIRKGPERTGEEVYQYRCKGCHAKNTQGAPMPSDKFAWSKRLNKGFDVLMEHAMDGYNNFLMPPKGGCRDCNEKEIRRAVIYMLEASGIVLSEQNIRKD